MRIGLELCFIDKSLNGEYYYDLFNRFVNFSPAAFRKKYKTSEWNEKKHLKILKATDWQDSISVYDLKGNILSAGRAGLNNHFANVTIEQAESSGFLTDESILKSIQNDKFVSAYLYDVDYVEVQSTESINNLKHKDIPEHLYSTLKDTPYSVDMWGGLKYDIRYNPGRKDLISYTWLMAAWKMWFGKPFFDLVPKQKLLEFIEEYKIKEQSDGIIFVQLYENLEESWTFENMRLQQKWRDWIGFDSLIKLYS